MSQQLALGPVRKLRRFVDQGRSDAMAQVGIARPMVQIAVIRILVFRGTYAVAVAVGFRILQTMRPGVDGKQREILAEAMLSGNPKRIVIGVDAIVRERDIRIECALDGIKQRESPARLCIGDGRSSGNIHCGVLFQLEVRKWVALLPR